MTDSTNGVAPTRRPLTDDRIDELWEALEHKAPVYFCRAVEREHGITNGVALPQGGSDGR